MGCWVNNLAIDVWAVTSKVPILPTAEATCSASAAASASVASRTATTAPASVRPRNPSDLILDAIVGGYEPKSLLLSVVSHGNHEGAYEPHTTGDGITGALSCHPFATPV
nr:hypothetical protein Iba_chr13aCG11970 [Ipomoea batatas]